MLASTIHALLREAVPAERRCNICNRSVLFRPMGWPMRPEARCPNCGSLERHRLLKMWFDKEHESIIGTRILHFAPEPAVSKFVRPLTEKYTTADIKPGYDLQLNIEKIDLPDESYDLIVCSHVLEHVDDRAALKEMRRVLKENGIALLMTPVIEGWSETYEDPAIVEPNDRVIHFGQGDHVRYYGANLRARIRHAGFELEEFTIEGAAAVEYGLLRGERLFVAIRRRV